VVVAGVVVGYHLAEIRRQQGELLEGVRGLAEGVGALGVRLNGLRPGERHSGADGGKLVWIPERKADR
jgi:hypothetical protein